MMKRTCAGLVLAVVCLAGPRVANAATASFGDLAVPGTGVVNFGATVLHDGFTFSSNLGSGPQGLSVWKTLDVNHPAGGAATTSLFDFTAGNKTTIVRSDAGVFGLTSIDLAQYGVGLASFPTTFAVKFTGTKADLTTIEQTFTVANFIGTPQLQTFAFSNFTNLISVSVIQGTYITGTAFQFTNLVYSTAPSVFCDTQVNQASYINGEPVQVPVLRFANQTSGPVATEIKVWLGVGATAGSIINAGANGSIALPSGFDINVGPFTLFTVTPGMARGGYEFSCRILDPATGEVLATKRSSFVIH